MREWIEKQVKEGSLESFDNLNIESKRVDILIEYYRNKICNSTAEDIRRNFEALKYEESFKQDLNQARHDISRKLASTILNITV